MGKRLPKQKVRKLLQRETAIELRRRRDREEPAADDSEAWLRRFTKPLSEDRND